MLTKVSFMLSCSLTIVWIMRIDLDHRLTELVAGILESAALPRRTPIADVSHFL
jgi:hypothetical protein